MDNSVAIPPGNKNLTDAARRAAAKAFAEFWRGKGYEKGESQPFWLSLLRDVFGVAEPEKFISFENRIQLANTSFIDAAIPATKVLIEQKGADKDLRKAARQSDGSLLTPFQQAKRYAAELPYSARPRWIVVCNFAEFHVHDLERPHAEPEIVRLENLEKEYYRLNFLVDEGDENTRREFEISIKAGELVGLLYDEFLAQYRDPSDPRALRSLNVLCVRLVFCLYAEDAGIFGRHAAFHDYLRAYDAPHARRALIELFRVLDTRPEDRDPYLAPELAAFPYVNGGLFADENVEIPNFTDRIRSLLLREASENFDWSEISPTIFGAVFESTLNPETRRSGGMHYTSLENIHKVIDPLFLDELRAEFEAARAEPVERSRERRFEALRARLASLAFLDPACGSGNFLTETYLSLRRLENDVLRERSRQIEFDLTGDLIRVSIGQFYGIEINDFAVTVAKTALWIAESQMLKETEDIVRRPLDFLPLKSYANIVEGNALRIDWASVVPREKLSFIMGNPPFVGQAMRNREQAKDLEEVFYPSRNWGKLDYVAGWFKKAADFMQNTQIETAFVSSNSVCQGESVNLLWELLLKTVTINFAYEAFKWESEAKNKAAVHCIIVGFASCERSKKILFNEKHKEIVSHINGYLKDAPDIYIKNRSTSINENHARAIQGSPPADDGRLLLSASEKDELLKKYPQLKPVIFPFVGSREFINDTEFNRYCLWFENQSPAIASKIPELIERFNYIRKYRLKSPVDRIQKTAERPYLFTQNRQPKTKYLLIPRVSSEKRKYIPIGFLEPDIIASDSVVLICDATLYDFGIICSNVHNAWMRTICGRLKSDYRYAPSIYYNFPFPKCSAEQQTKIKKTGQMILAAREKYERHSLAEMYGESMYLFPELLEAHKKNDIAVMEAYGIEQEGSTDGQCVSLLMKIYQELISRKENNMPEEGLSESDLEQIERLIDSAIGAPNKKSAERYIVELNSYLYFLEPPKNNIFREMLSYVKEASKHTQNKKHWANAARSKFYLLRFS